MARWNSCNLLQFAADAKRLWQFDAKGGGFVPNRDLRVPHADPLPAKLVAKNWSSLWQPKLNVAWLPPENVFLRVIELPASNALLVLNLGLDEDLHPTMEMEHETGVGEGVTILGLPSLS